MKTLFKRFVGWLANRYLDQPPRSVTDSAGMTSLHVEIQDLEAKLAHAEEELAKAKAGNAALQKFITIRHQPDKVQEPPLKIVKPFALAAMLFAFTASAQFPPPYVHNVLDTNDISAGTGIVITHAGGIATIAATGGGTNVNYFFVDANGNVTTLSNVYLPNVFVGNVIFTNWTFVNGLTTNVALLAANGSTNTLQFYGGILTNVMGSAASCIGSAITVQPSNVSSLTNRNVSFSVTATGTAPISYQWLSNNVNVGNGTDFSGATASTLIVSNVTIAANDGEVFKCTVWNCGATNTSSTATLTVTNGTPGGGNGLLNNLVAVYEMEQNDATDATDATGNGKTLTHHGATAFSTTHIQGSRANHGGASANWDTSDGAFNTTGDWGWSGWAHAAIDGDIAFSAGNAAKRWLLYFDGAGVLPGGANHWKAVVRNGTDTGNFIAASTITANDAAWHLIVVSYNSSTKVISISVNGETFVASAATDGTDPTGQNWALGTGATLIDENAYWSTQRTQQNVTDLIGTFDFGMQTGTPLFYSGGLWTN